ncbi:MAG TPA: DUF4410 domain-containing protein [Verrucomicrobiae bacterium]|nr:DUF4410 domain-containing protein [Verrucomicrobiae bacterium]
MRRGTIWLCGGFAVALLVGCASVSVKDVDQGRRVKPKRKPATVYVMPFSTEGAQFNVDREGAELESFKHDTAVMLADLTSERIRAQLAPSQIIGVHDSLPEKGWVVRGRFIAVNQGSRALRTIVGLGAGATKMQVAVSVCDLSRSSSTPFLTFETEGGSGSMPGIITSPGPVSAGLSMVGGSIRGVTDDAQRTARMITARLSEYMLERKWIKPEQATSVKRAGDFTEPTPASTAKSQSKPPTKKMGR